MVNLVPKFFIRLKNKFLDLNNRRLKSRWIKIFDKTNSSGYLIEAIQIKLIKMSNDWPSYKWSEDEKKKLSILIGLSEELLVLLAEEEEHSHIRTKDFKTKQKHFFNKLHVYSDDLFY